MSWLNKNFPRVNATANTIYRASRLYTANRSFRAWQSLLSYLWRRTQKQIIPTFITVAPTYRCVCKCVHCGVSSPSRNHSDELSTKEIKSVIEQAEHLGVLQITFTGGEPLMREDIFELVQYAHQRGLLTRINTSGLLLSRESVLKLKKSGLTQCAVSIDDAEPEIHDKLRGVPGAFNKAVQGIRYLKESNVLCQINTYAARRNVTAGLKKIIELGRSLGVLAVYIILPTAIGHWDFDFDQVLTDKEKEEVRELQETTFVHLELATPKTLCGIYKKMILFVSPQGSVTPCPFVSYDLGNIREHKLSDLWYHHIKELKIECLGECPMNVKQFRESLKKHVQSVAGKEKKNNQRSRNKSNGSF